jgi:hypothetical protein
LRSKGQDGHGFERVGSILSRDYCRAGEMDTGQAL